MDIRTAGTIDSNQIPSGPSSTAHYGNAIGRMDIVRIEPAVRIVNTPHATDRRRFPAGGSGFLPPPEPCRYGTPPAPLLNQAITPKTGAGVDPSQFNRINGTDNRR